MRAPAADNHQMQHSGKEGVSAPGLPAIASCREESHTIFSAGNKNPTHRGRIAHPLHR
jgi:hypothetical protein